MTAATPTAAPPAGVGELAAALEHRLRRARGATGTVSGLRALTGGASRQTWSFTVTTEDDAAGPSTEDLILRRDPPAAEEPERMAMETAAIRAAGRVGVPVPRVLAASADDGPGGAADPAEAALGGAYVVVTREAGEALPPKLLADPAYAELLPTLPRQLGRLLARIHRVPIAEVPQLADGDVLDALAEQYRSTGEPVPALEIAFSWLRAHRPPAAGDGLVHGDFRNGNLLITPDGVQAVLDWELAHRGDPMEDLGWLCSRAWRFGRAAPVGGFGSREELFAGYAEVSGVQPEPQTVHWWEVYGTLRWAVMCRYQAQRGRTDDVDNALELFAIGRRLAECEYDLLNLLGFELHSDRLPDGPEALPAVFGSPEVSELLTPVRGLLRSATEQAAAHEPRLRYAGRVASHVLRIVERQAELGPRATIAGAAALSAAGCSDEVSLAQALADGSADVDDAAVRAAVALLVGYRIAVANPGY